MTQSVHDSLYFSALFLESALFLSYVLKLFSVFIEAQFRSDGRDFFLIKNILRSENFFTNSSLKCASTCWYYTEV